MLQVLGGGHTLKLEKPGSMRDSRKYLFSVTQGGITLELFGSRNGGCTFKGRLDKLKQTRRVD